MEFIVDVSFEPNIEAMRQAGITELVRCKDCKHYYKGHCQCEDTIYWNRDPEWFCADGVKKDDR